MKKPTPPEPKEKARKPLTNEQRIAVRSIFEEVYRANRWHVIWTNFLRGIAVGFGTVVGGVILVAILVWILSATVDWFPMIRDFTQRLIDALQQ